MGKGQPSLGNAAGGAPPPLRGDPPGGALPPLTRGICPAGGAIPGKWAPIIGKGVPHPSEDGFPSFGK